MPHANARERNLTPVNALPLSSTQQMVWLDQTFNDAADYHIGGIMGLEGAFDVERFTHAFEQVVRQHDALRLRLDQRGSLAQQYVMDTLTIPVEQVDLSRYDDAEARAQQVIASYNEAPFMLDDRMWRCVLIRVGEQRWYWQLLSHHLASDGVSFILVVNDIIDAYRDQRRKTTERAPSYLEFVRDDAAYLDSKYYARDLAFWTSRFQQMPDTLLTVKASADDKEPLRTTPLEWPLSDAQYTTISALVAQHGFSLQHFIYAIVACYFARTTDAEEIVIGVPIHNRRSASQKETVGMFASVIPVSVTIAPDDSVLEVMNKAASELRRCYRHQRLPIAEINRHLQVQQKTGRAQLFDVLALSASHVYDLRTPDECFGPLIPHQGTLFPLSVMFSHYHYKREYKDECCAKLKLIYSSRYLNEAEAQAIKSRLMVLIDAVIAAPETPLAELPLMPDAERRYLLETLNATQHAFPEQALMHELFEEQVARAPKAIALHTKAGSMCYDTLNRRANRLAHALIARGVHPDDRVAICLERGDEMLVAMLATLKAGGAYLNLDLSYPEARLNYMIDDAAPAVLITRGEYRAMLSGAAQVVLMDDEAVVADQPDHNLMPAALGLHARHLAQVIYTSGSTGQPKGVMIEHRNVARLVKNNSLPDITPQDCMAHCANTSFDTSTWEIWSALLNGAALYLIPQDVLLEPTRFRDALKEGGVTSLFLTTGLFHEYLDTLMPVIPQLRYLVIAGDVLDPGKVAQLQQGDAMPAHLLNCYGPTEATTFATAFEVDYPLEALQPLPIGRPIGNTRVYLLDAQHNLVPNGTVGEVYIAGEGVARGYFHRDELTAERFLQDPFSANAHDNMYKTGDLARWRADGTLDFLGRNDHQIKLRGFRIELGEIEARLAQHPAVREAVVMAREDTPGTKQLVAYLISSTDTPATPTELRQHLSQQVADYMVPSAFVTLTRYPLMPNGKLDRKALPMPDSDAVAARDYQAPVGATETLLAEMWQTLLGIERVGREDHFFELGGHSLLIVSMIERLRDAGWHLEGRAIFAMPILKDLAQVLDGEDASRVAFDIPPNQVPSGCTQLTPDMLSLVTLAEDELERIVASVDGGAANVQEIYPLSPLQDGILFHHLMQTEGDNYLIRCLLAFDSQARRERFINALQRVIDRHDILRTALCWEDIGEPVQVVWRQATLAVETFTLSMDAEDVEAQLLAHTDPSHLHMDLRRAPLFVTHVAENPATGEWLLALTFHHVICDHLTLELLLNEIALLMVDQPDTLSVPQPYRNFIAQVLAAPKDTHEAYFRDRLGTLEAPSLPFGVADCEGEINEAFLTLSDTLARALRAQARQLRVSASVLFHAACARVIAQLSGQDDVVMGTVLLGRMQGAVGADQTLGLFLNTLPLRVSMANASVYDVVKATQDNLSGLLAHEQAPLSLAQRCSGVSSGPLFNTLLNYRHTQNDLNTWEGMRVAKAQDRTHYPITLSVDDLGEGFRIQAQTAATLDAERIARYLLTALTHIVQALEEDAHGAMTHLSILPSEERQQLLETFNATQGAHASGRISTLFEAQAARTPARTAAVLGKHSMSYAELDAEANRWAHGLIALGVQPGDTVAICVERSLSMLIALLAALKAGAAYLPLDPSYPEARLAYMLEDAAPKVLLTQTSLQDRLNSSIEQTLLLDAPPTAVKKAPECTPDIGSMPDDALGYVIYTSGSTGQPKGVEMPQTALLNLLAWHREHPTLTGSGRTLQFAALGFDVAFQEVFTTLCEGGCLVLIDETVRHDPKALLQLIREQQVDRLFLPYVALQQLADSAEQVDGSFAGLNDIVTAGEQLHMTPAIRSLLDRAAPCRLHNHYGPTESHVSMAHTLHPPATQWPALPAIGTPICNTQAYVLDAYRHPVPIGVSGELFIAGDCLARGYLHRDDVTAASFVPNPFVTEPGARMYGTGDLVRWRADGTLDYLGRNDFQVKVRGFRIELGEIESCLAHCDGVREAVVMLREDTPGEKRLVAYLRVDEGREAAPSQLREQLSHQLADYMVPSAFVTLTRFPLTPNGKLDRMALPAPDVESLASREYEAPKGQVETTLASIWQSLLAAPRVGRHDHFFELGGHSLSAVRLVTRIRTEFQVDVSVASLFDRPVLAEQAEMIISLQLSALGEEEGVSLRAMLDDMSPEELAAMLEGDEH